MQKKTISRKLLKVMKATKRTAPSVIAEAKKLSDIYGYTKDVAVDVLIKRYCK